MNNKLRVLSLFSGIGAFEKGLEKQDISYELVGFSEIDKYAIESYCAIHNVDKTKNLGDISKVKGLHKYNGEVDLIVGGSPCQDFSIAGKQQGSIFECLDCGQEFNPLTVHYTKRNNCPNCNSENLEKTRSSLLIEYLRTIREIKPKYFVYENVKNIIGKKFKEAFDLFETELKEYGYNTYYQVLNAKDYGVPQNRERVFVIGIRNDIEKDFKFPEKQELKIRLKDVLEDVVDEKYYINKEWHFTKEGEQKHDNNEIAQIDNVNFKALRTITDPNKICRCLDTMGGGQREPKVLLEENKPILVGGIGEINFGKQYRQGNRIYSDEGIAMCLLSQPVGNAGGNSYLYKTDYRVRKLTPKECWRLMGFEDEDIDKCIDIKISNSQLYKQSGNSIVVNVLEEIFKNLL